MDSVGSALSRRTIRKEKEMGTGYSGRNIKVAKGLSGAAWPVTCPDGGSAPALALTEPIEVDRNGELTVVDGSVVLMVGDRPIAHLESPRLIACIQMGHRYRGELLEREGRLEVRFERI
jgi:hypothetical protein